MGEAGGSFRRSPIGGYVALLAAMALVAVAPLATQGFGVETPEPSENAAVIAELRAALDQTAFRLALLEARSADTGEGELGPQEDVRSVAVAVGLLSLREQSRTDQPFASELALIRPLLSRVPGSDAAIAPLLAYADAGVPSVADLAVEFGRLEPLLVAQINAAGSVGRQGRELVRSMLAAVHLAQAVEPDLRLVILEQTRIDLSRGRLDTAVATIESLDPPTRLIASGWLAAARVRLALDRSVEALVQGALAAMVAAP
jgi:hypothetical protein